MRCSHRKAEHILIVGAGTFGLSTAFELANNGYSNITVLERASTIPSPFSAGCDLNKIVRAEYEDRFYTDLALEAMEAWKEPFFAPFYAERGILMLNSPAAEQKAKDSMNKAFSSIKHHAGFPSEALSKISSGDEIRSRVPQLQGKMDGWGGYSNSHGGYVLAGRAMARLHIACKEMGVKFFLGAAGQAVALLRDGRKCVGVRTQSGETHRASRTILCLGAHAASLLPSIGPQITAKAWSVAHLQLTSAQVKGMLGIPVINCRDLGFFFEPDAETGLLKLCAHSAGLTNHTEIDRVEPTSLPSTLNLKGSKRDAGCIPSEDHSKIVKLIAEALPQFSHLPLTRMFICWCGDTKDSNYIIDYCPEFDGQSLMVFSGDSGHAFKMLPIAGRWAREVLETGKQSLDRWKWKHAPQWFSNEVSWRIGATKDVTDVKEWVYEEEESRFKL